MRYNAVVCVVFVSRLIYILLFYRKVSYNEDMNTKRNSEIVELYVSGLSSQELSERYKITPRSIQRLLKKLGIIRTQKESFNLAIKRGRMKYYRLPVELKKQRKRIQDKLRFFILNRDNFRCVLCGASAKECLRLEIDHIDNDPMNNIESNLQVLCSNCNKGKAWLDIPLCS